MTKDQYTDLIHQCMKSAVTLKRAGVWEWTIHNDLAMTLRIERDNLWRVGALD